jgi:hypothetical protein
MQSVVTSFSIVAFVDIVGTTVPELLDSMDSTHTYATSVDSRDIIGEGPYDLGYLRLDRFVVEDSELPNIVIASSSLISAC